MEFLNKLQLEEINHGSSIGASQWLHGKKNHLLESINPTNEKVIAKVLTADAETYEKIILAAETTFRKWREFPAPKRGEIIGEIAQKLRQVKNDLGTLVALEMGKSKQEGDGEVQEMIDIADFAVGQSRMLYGKTMHSERYHHRMYEQWHPYGVVGVITAFNFPVAVWAWNAFIAAICGNTVIWKPSSKVPLCAIAVQHICNEVFAKHNLPGVFNLLISEDHKISELMLDDTRVPLISFTGSTQVGKKVSERVAKRLGRTILELGGNNAIIIDETADLKLAIPAIVFGAIGTAGQRCTSTRRIIIHEKIYNELMRALVNAYQQIKIGDPLDVQNQMGPLIDRDAVLKYRDAMKQLKKMGAEIFFGGQVIERAGFFVEPCIVRSENNWDIVQQEIFAPILHVMPYFEFEEALQMHNGVKQGLSSALFTQSLKNAESYLSVTGSDCGIANINVGTSGAEIGGAFGGEKETGGGREAGSDAWKYYMRRQTNTINWSDSLPLAQGIKFNI